MFRKWIIYFVSNEKIINKLADFKPIRQCARFVAHLLLQVRTGNPFLKDEYIKSLGNITNSMKEKLQELKNEIKKYPPK